MYNKGVQTKYIKLKPLDNIERKKYTLNFLIIFSSIDNSTCSTSLHGCKPFKFIQIIEKKKQQHQ